MVTFNELRICEDGNYLIVDCEIDNVDVFKNMYIQNIYLEYYKNASSVGMPSDKAHVIYENKYDDASVKSKRVVFSKAELSSTEFGISSFDGEMFYVIVECGGAPTAEISYMPCGEDDPRTIGVVIDWRLFYSRGMGYIASLFDDCGNPCQPTDEFEHFIILWNALRLAVETCDWEMVKDLWDKFRLAKGTRGDSAFGKVFGGCGCGR